MKKLALILVLLGSTGLGVEALSFAADQHAIWMRAVKQLPDRATFTRNEVIAVIRSQVEQTKSRYLLGVAFAAVAIVGNSILVVRNSRAGSRGSDKPQNR